MTKTKEGRMTKQPQSKVLAKKSSLEKSGPIHWSAICRSLYMTGQMKDFKKGECWRVRKLLMAQVKLGNVEQIARGIYQIKPALLARLDRFE
jgi:hypothetical protein